LSAPGWSPGTLRLLSVTYAPTALSALPFR
jgi:hypothetical protein